MPPRMIVVAGPPGSGKSTVFRPEEAQLDYFNADERARDMNNGSGRNISREIRSRINGEREQFIADRGARVLRIRRRFGLPSLTEARCGHRVYLYRGTQYRGILNGFQNPASPHRRTAPRTMRALARTQRCESACRTFARPRSAGPGCDFS